MRNLIFDLDGTLWNTIDAYYYAYNKYITNHPRMECLLNFEEIANFRGLTMDEMAPKLLPNATKEKQKEVILECLKYSCEYLENEPINPETVKIIKKLQQKYDLYIVSNCPLIYGEIFFKKTNLKDFFKDFFFLGGFQIKNQYDKGENIKRMIEKHDLKDVVFIGDSEIDLKNANWANVDFINYGKDNEFNYFPQILDLEELLDVEKVMEYAKNKNNILKLADYYVDIKYHDAYLTYIYNSKQKQYKHLFGFIKLSKDKSVNKHLMEKLIDIAYLNKAKQLVGPVNYATWFEYRLPISKFNWQLKPDIAGTKEDIDFLYEFGFNNLYTYKSTLATINTKLAKLASNASLKLKYKVRVIKGKETLNYSKEIFEISKESFEEAYLYTEISYEVFCKTYLNNLNKIIDILDLVLVYDDDKIVGYGLCYPNFTDNMYICKTAAIKKEYQNKKVVIKLAEYVYKMADEYHMKEILFHFQNEQKHTLQAFWRNNTIKEKRYAVFIKELEE